MRTILESIEEEGESLLMDIDDEEYGRYYDESKGKKRTNLMKFKQPIWKKSCFLASLLVFAVVVAVCSNYSSIDTIQHPHVVTPTSQTEEGNNNTATSLESVASSSDSSSTWQVTINNAMMSSQAAEGTNNTVIISESVATSSDSSGTWQVTTWNIAAINNNPFEYWITYDEDPAYEQLMVDVEKFLEQPRESDVAVSQVFTEEMFNALDSRLVDDMGWASVRSYWESDFRQRRIISGFVKDPSLGSKRLASMPDRVTNTIHTALTVNDNGESNMVFRPTVINMFDGDLGSQPKWWKEWESFMFDTPLNIAQKDGSTQKMTPAQMLLPISRTKYPAVTEQEEIDSLPLQTLCGAIFDAILVHIMNTVSEPHVWQPLKQVMVENLNKKKVPHTLSILSQPYYHNSDIITLQEVASSMVTETRSYPPLANRFHILSSQNMDVTRDQNSIILLNKQTFPEGMISEITPQIEAQFAENTPVAKGDLFAITADSADGTPVVVVSFHGDTNGLATKPVLNAITQAMSVNPHLVHHKLIFGLDANTYEHGTPDLMQDVTDWGRHYVSHGLTSCWGDMPNPSNYTTYNARTFLQPQLNKACKRSEKRTKGDVNPKDFILFRKQDFTVLETWKDNTGHKEYTEDMAFPTLQFPSDHGILSTIIQPTIGMEDINTVSKKQDDKQVKKYGDSSIRLGPNSPYAYAFLVGGCDRNEPSSQYFLHDVMVATQILRDDGSKADILCMIQMGPNSEDERLQPHEEAWLDALQIRVQYIPKSGANSRYSIMMEKFRILTHDEYKRILFLDADVLPMGNLDYVFELSAEQGVLKESLVVPGLSTPANGGFFMVTPYPGALEDLDAILKEKEDRKNLDIMQSSNNNERIRGKHVDTKYFDPVMGWGHQITPPDKWIKVGGSGVEWDFIAAYADQGLLYHFTKYFRQSLSVVLGNQVQNWGSDENNETILEETVESPFAEVTVPPYRGVVDNCWRWSTNTDGNCYPPMADYQHFNGKQKPWIVGPPELQPTPEHAQDSPQHLWFYYLDQLNRELDMGLNFAEWGKDEPNGEWTPPVGFHLRPDAQAGVTTNLVGN